MNRQVVVVVVAALCAGVLLGRIPSCLKSRGGGVTGGVGESAESGSGALLNSFESDRELKLWQTTAAKIERVAEHAAHGSSSGKVTLFGDANTTMSAIKIENAFERGKLPRDWRSYERLEFTVFNPTSNRERVILQLKDADDARFKKNVWLDPNQETRVRVFLDAVKQAIKIDKVTQFNIFRWEPKSDLTLYIDDIRLLKAEQ